MPLSPAFAFHSCRTDGGRHGVPRSRRHPPQRAVVQDLGAGGAGEGPGDPRGHPPDHLPRQPAALARHRRVARRARRRHPRGTAQGRQLAGRARAGPGLDLHLRRRRGRRPDRFAANTQELIEVGALPSAYGWSKTRIIDAIERAVETPAGMASIHELLHDLPQEASAAIAYAETVGACAVAMLAAVNQGLGTCLHMIARPTTQERVQGDPRRPGALGAGVGAARRATRPRGRGRWAAPAQPTSRRSSSRATVGTPFPRDPKVVERDDRGEAAAGAGARCPAAATS